MTHTNFLKRGSVPAGDNLKFVEQNPLNLLTIIVLFVSYARRFNTIQIFSGCPTFST
jgi:hypothetical protein